MTSPIEECPAEKCLQSLRQVNEAVFSCSENTIFSSPMFKAVPTFEKAEWLAEKKITESFSQAFNENKVNEKLYALSTPEVNFVKKLDSYSGTAEQTLLLRKGAIEKDLEKIKDGLLDLNSSILNSLRVLESSHIPSIGQH